MMASTLMAGPEYRNVVAGARAPPIDPRKQGEHSAGAHCQDRAGDRGHRVRQDLLRLGPEVLHDRRLTHEHRDSTCDEERRDQTEEHVFLGVLLEHQKGFQPRPSYRGMIERNGIGGQENRHDEKKLGMFAQ